MPIDSVDDLDFGSAQDQNKIPQPHPQDSSLGPVAIPIQVAITFGRILLV